ncbi:chitinase [Streptomyces sp. NPDC005209]|uniref:chitinase n=1 Tax=Streptomyces sp. NPDC005209 TaxID=3156715 RepID=UPI0033AF5B62
MRGFLRPAAGLTCTFAMAVTGCSADSDSGGTSYASGGTSYAPYVSATDASATDSAGSPATYNLSFVISNGSGCTPKWDGSEAIGDPAVQSRIARLKRDGATVRVSFGGASGKELAQACDSASDLAAAYGKALDDAGSARADFDIEGATLTDSDSVALRSKAIAELQRDRPDLEVTFTLPVMPSGLDSDGLALLESANTYDVQVSTVNIMTMNYAESYDGDMGDYALTSARATHAQLKKVFALSDADAWRGMALTSMIGVNDVAGETFTLSDAAQVRAFAEKKEIAWVSMWSSFRDRQCAHGRSGRDDPATDCSGVKQSSGAFGRSLSG